MSAIWPLSILLIVSAVLIVQIVSIFVDSCTRDLLSSNALWFIFFVVMLAFNCFLIGCINATKCEREAVKTKCEREAVKAGVAHYVADESGNSKFEYIKK